VYLDARRPGWNDLTGLRMVIYEYIVQCMTSSIDSDAPMPRTHEQYGSVAKMHGGCIPGAGSAGVLFSAGENAGGRAYDRCRHAEPRYVRVTLSIHIGYVWCDITTPIHILSSQIRGITVPCVTLRIHFCA
jgi:hypothetical protein